MNICAFLGRVAALHPERRALSLGEEPAADYARLYRRVAAIAGALRGRLGLQPGDRVGMAMKNRPAYVEAQLACWHAGLCVVPMNAKLHRREFAYMLEHCAASLCFVGNELAEEIGSLVGEVPSLRCVISVDDGDYARLAEYQPLPLAEVAYDDPAWIFYTSGTTGRPKGATLSHRNLWGMSWRYFADIDPVSTADTYLHAAPISHGSGLYGLPFLMKGAHLIVPASGGFDVDEVFAAMERHRNLTFFAAPTMITRMTAHPGAARARVDSLKTVYYGGAPMYLQDMKRALAAFGPRFYQIFGQGESPMTGVGLSQALHADAGHPRFEARLASTGLARSGVEVRIVDEEDRDLPLGEAGEVLFRSDVTMLGYWRNPEATAAALRGGWLHTGDIGVFDEDGFVTLKDRSKDMIISGGSNIYPREIEEVLLTDARIAEVSVVGRPHPDWGEEVVAFVAPVEGASVTPQELEALCLANIARFKRPKDYLFVRELPKSNYGKILKTELRRLLEAPVRGTSQ